jgi:phenylacetate-coenzyme A ligase PaaK-like adenylate-forming protein
VTGRFVKKYADTHKVTTDTPAHPAADGARVREGAAWLAGQPFYRRKPEQAGLKPEQIRTLDDVQRLPFITRDELKQRQVRPPALR